MIIELHIEFLLSLVVLLLFFLIFVEYKKFIKIKKDKMSKNHSFNDEDYDENQDYIDTDQRIKNLNRNLNNFIQNKQDIHISDIKKLIKEKRILEAENLLNVRKDTYYNYIKNKKNQQNIQQKIQSLTEKISGGEISSKAFERAREDLDKEMKENEEKIWKLKNKLFKDEYEKPF